MKFSVMKTDSFEYYNEVDEVIFLYYGTEDLYGQISNTLTREEQVANIRPSSSEVDKDIFFGLLDKINNEFNVLVSINFNYQREYADILKEKNIPFMFYNLAKDFSTVKAMQMAGASEVCIVEDLCFSLDKIQDFRKEGLKIRMYPDVAQVASGCSNLPVLTNFWVRPEDVELYAQYVDTFEIWHDKNLSTIFKIYKQGQWKGDIREIITDYRDSLENTSIAPYFGQSRISCGKACLHGRCNVCFRIQELAERFNEADISILREKKEFKKNEPENA